jgi:mRNA interferase MazF
MPCGRRSIGAPTSGARSLTTEVFEPDEGDLIWTDFDPRIGREQGGRRPALVISPVEFWRASRFAIVCPITSRIRPFGTSVVLPPGLPIGGEILAGHVRSIDTMSRPVVSLNHRVPASILDDVRAKLAALMGFNG